MNTVYVGRKDVVINRFGKKFMSGEDGTLEATTAEEAALFEVYGFVAETAKEPVVVEEPKEEPKEEEEAPVPKWKQPKKVVPDDGRIKIKVK